MIYVQLCTYTIVSIKLSMNKKISSGLTKIFQIALITKFIILSIIIFITLFIFDFKTNLIIITCWIIGLFILRRMGITKLKTVHWNEQSILIGSLNSKKIIPLTDIKNVERTFLFDDLPYKIKYMESRTLKEFYFLPKSKLLQDMLSENELIEELKKEIKKSNANNGNRCTSL